MIDEVQAAHLASALQGGEGAAEAVLRPPLHALVKGAQRAQQSPLCIAHGPQALPGLVLQPGFLYSRTQC